MSTPEQDSGKIKCAHDEKCKHPNCDCGSMIIPSVGEKPDMQAIETRYMNDMMNRLMEKRFGLSFVTARDIARDLFYTFVFPIYELGGQYGFTTIPARKRIEELTAKEIRADRMIVDLVHEKTVLESERNTALNTVDELKVKVQELEAKIKELEQYPNQLM